MEHGHCQPKKSASRQMLSVVQGKACLCVGWLGLVTVPLAGDLSQVLRQAWGEGLRSDMVQGRIQREGEGKR